MALETNLKVLFKALVLVNLLSLTTIHCQTESVTNNSSSNVSATAREAATSRYQEGKIARKITIIVGDEEPVTVNDRPTTDQPLAVPTGKHSGCLGNVKTESKFYLDATTKLIYVDENNESGYLIGKIISNNGTGEDTGKNHDQQFASTTSRTQKGSSDFFADRFHKNRPSPNFNREQSGNNPTNYSIYLVSRNKDHIAILIDVDEVNFEPIINCEYQELRFSIVGEISKQLLSRKNGTDPTVRDEISGDGSLGAQESVLQEADDTESSSSLEEGSSDSSSAVDSSAPPLPVSEAMAMLLNAPLNKTILDESDETNDFKVIDSTIDYLHEETCHELLLAKGNQERIERPEIGHNRNNGRKTNKNKRRVHQKSAPKGRKKQQDNICHHESKQFKDLMSNKLQENFEWDDFKIICGKTKQLVIPMRSMKLSVYSDEFSPNSRFVIRYQFISDPKLLPAQDNGKYYCRNRNIIDLSLKCNGVDDCDDASDESIKVCGYPTGRSNVEPTSSAHPPASSSSTKSSTNKSRPMTTATTTSTPHIQSKRKLTYVNGDVLHCCQSNDWMSVMPQGRANQMINLQSLIGESMNLFLGPLFAPTSKEFKPKRRTKRIVGGGVAQRGAWPGQVSLQYELLEPLCHFCAGTLIHPQYVLTAGHCITKDGLNRGIKVVLGAHDLRQLNGNHIQARYVDDAQIYPGVDVKHLSFDWENDMNNDIALLRLNAPVLITPHVAPACLPPFNTPLAINTNCRSIGWGQTHGSGSSNLLKHLSLKVVNSSFCSKELFDRDNDSDKDLPGKKKISLKDFERLDHNTGRRSRFASDFESTALDQYSDLTMVCVNNDLGHGICQGDSGGPLYCDRVLPTGEHCTEIYGVASFIIQYATVGAMCAVENLPGIFGEVSSKTEWISSTIKMFEQSYRLKYS